MPHNTDDAPSVVRLRWPDANGATLCGSPYGGEAGDSRAAASLGGAATRKGCGAFRSAGYTRLLMS